MLILIGTKTHLIFRNKIESINDIVRITARLNTTQITFNEVDNIIPNHGDSSQEKISIVSDKHPLSNEYHLSIY